MELLSRFGAAVCHRMAERSLYFDGMQMPLCARCTGIYLGAFFAFFFLFWKGRKEGNRPFSLPQALLTAAAILPVAADGLGSYLGFWQSSAFLRLLTGSLVGVILPGMLLLAVNFDPAGDNTAPVYENSRELLMLMLVSAGIGLSLWAGLPFHGIAALLSVAGEILLWGGVFWLVLKLAGKKRKLPYWRISIGCAAVLLFLIGGLVV
ncbi:MAG: DUF2085 domain-containing protein [Bacillota bacterium]|nr:DUF2085 domain-containing protein [Bacillota bacterium]